MSVKNKILIGLFAATVAVGALSACSAANDDAVLITADDGDVITYGYGKLVARYNQALYDQIYVSYFGSNVWGEDVGDGVTFEEDVKGDILDDLEEEYLAVKHASEYGAKVTAEEETQIAEAVSEFLATNTDEAIELLGADEDNLTEFLRRQTIRAKVKEAIRSEASVDIADEDADESTISYVRYSFADETSEDPEAENEEKREAATKLSEAEDFDAEVESQGVAKQAYSFLRNADPSEDTSMGPEIMLIAATLSDGEVSPVIEVPDKGYYVVRMDAVSDSDATAAKRLELETNARDSYYEEILEGWKADTTWEVDERLWSTITFDKLFSLTESDEEGTGSAE